MHATELIRGLWGHAIAFTMKGLVGFFLPCVFAAYEGMLVLTPEVLFRVMASGILWGFGIAGAMGVVCVYFGLKQGKLTLRQQVSVEDVFDEEELEAFGHTA